MTVCTTLGEVALTPILTKILAGTYVPVDAAKLSISTLQVLIYRVHFLAVVKIVIPFAPLFAVLAASLLACSVFSENVVCLKASMVAVTLPADLSLMAHAQTVLSGEVGVVILSVLLVHTAGFFVGYISAAVCGFREALRRAISIEVGMQNSSLGVVLATSHFTSPMVALPATLSTVIMNIMGGSLAFFWRYVDPSDSKETPTVEVK
ncbi:putative sodium/metabolite cotransporter BASS2 chloroplastic [Prunus yedoensis var. nudiflora]|uniref:Putative sodium/metabolite cotransporter BASS2 chloroplastic n=1 Tax=Prunus yedoensis var. nudiflora TaxID=2094558 RepID=A0A314UAW6_PRUYE|nr:putative sodium/metabolite cotransporter BASS2 chloroplastic [Prunus yedoensis var. nudiflora]